MLIETIKDNYKHRFIALGVCLSHAAILDAMAHFTLPTCNDVFLCFSSLYWLSGVVILIKGFF